MNAAMLLLIALLGAHLFFDYAGQGDFMAKGKHPHLGSVGVPWRLLLWSHAAMHGAAVALITGIWWLFVFETVAHALIDFWKCEGRFSFAADQALHLACKVIWWGVVIWQA